MAVAGNEPLRIGLVNNMPDAALGATERQFHRLLSAGARGRALELAVYHFPEVERGEAGRTYLRARSRPLCGLFAGRLDGLVVTGAEPREATLRNEPYWDSFARLVDWAATNTTSAIWSCLAAHGAVLHLDGVERQRLPAKRSGVYGFDTATEHRLMRGAGATVATPHSRYNDLDAGQLVAAGYTILSGSADAGVDAFVKSAPSLFLFLQGHPEYDGDTLHREFRRDMTRYLSGEAAEPPLLPDRYHDAATRSAISAFLARARDERRPDLIHGFPALPATAPQAWQTDAARLFRNWVDLLAESRRETRASGPDCGSRP